MNKVKVLLLFCNWEGPSTPAIGITSIATFLISKGHDARIFDDAPYLMDQSDDSKDPREKILSVKKTKRSELFTLPNHNLLKDFLEELKRYQPKIVGISASRYGFSNGIQYLELVKKHFPDMLTVVGGAFAMSVPEMVIEFDCVDMVAIGDGEVPTETLCKKLAAGDTDLYNIEGLWAKDSNGNIHKNSLNHLFDINSNPPLQFELFDERRYYRPIGGHVRRCLPLEISRGCPSKCTNCSVPLFGARHKKAGNWYRIKSIEKIEENIRNDITKFRPEYYFFMAPTFLAFSKDYTEKFINMYRKYAIPFYIGTRPEMINRDKLIRLKEIGLDRLSVGVECGNEHYRKKMLGRQYSNNLLKKAFSILRELNLEVSTNIMIGLPDETKEMIFETISLVKEVIGPKINVTISIYQAYEGTPLYNYCIDNKLYKKEKIVNTNIYMPNIKSRYLTDDDVLKFLHTFNLYVRSDHSEWPEIDALDINSQKGKQRIEQLVEKYSGEVPIAKKENANDNHFPTPFTHC